MAARFACPVDHQSDLRSRRRAVVARNAVGRLERIGALASAHRNAKFRGGTRVDRREAMHRLSPLRYEDGSRRRFHLWRVFRRRHRHTRAGSTVPLWHALNSKHERHKGDPDRLDGHEGDSGICGLRSRTLDRDFDYDGHRDGPGRSSEPRSG